MKIELTDEQCQNFERRWSPDLSRRERRYYYVDYEVRLVLKGILMTYEFIIPKRGRWPKGNETGYGVDPIVAQVELEDGGAFNLYNGT